MYLGIGERLRRLLAKRAPRPQKTDMSKVRDTQPVAAARWRDYPQCTAISSTIERRCLRRAVEGGLCLQHALIRGVVGNPGFPQKRGYAWKQELQRAVAKTDLPLALPPPKKEWCAPSIYEVLLLPAPRSNTGWYDIDFERHPTCVWIWVKERGSPHIKVVSYEPSKESTLFPWLWRDETHRTRWDIFDEWRNEPVS